MMKKIIDIIDNANSVLIVSHKRPDGDSIASQIALYHALKSVGKSVYILNEHDMPEKFAFLQSDGIINHILNGNEYDTIVFLDCANMNRIGNNSLELIKPILKHCNCINIDHHTSNDHFCRYNMVNTETSSTCEMIYSLFEGLNININTAIATSLLTGIITDTGFFKFSNTSAETFEIVTKLIKKGANINSIAYEIYMNRPIEEIRLIRTVFERIEIIDDKIVSYIDNNDFLKTGAKSEYTDGIVNQILYIKGIKAAVLIIQDGNNVRISFRSKDEVYDMNKLASVFDGGGHKNAAGAYISNITIKEAVSKIKELLNKL